MQVKESIRTSLEEIRARKLRSMLTLSGVILDTVSLVIGGVGIFLVLRISIGERLYEIGLRCPYLRDSIAMASLRLSRARLREEGSSFSASLVRPAASTRRDAESERTRPCQEW